MRVSELRLRRKLNANGLDVDGSREAMIEALKNAEGSVSNINVTARVGGWGVWVITD